MGLELAPPQLVILNVVCEPGAAPFAERSRKAESQALPPSCSRTCTLVGPPPLSCQALHVHREGCRLLPQELECTSQLREGMVSIQSVSVSQGALKEGRTRRQDPGRQEGASGDVEAGDLGVGGFPGRWCRRGGVRAGMAPPLPCALVLSCRTDVSLEQEGVSGPCFGEHTRPGAHPQFRSWEHHGYSLFPRESSGGSVHG